MYQDQYPYNTQGTYQTGSTRPPKSRGGLIAFLLVVVILLLGAVTILGAMNVKLFKELRGDSGSDNILGLSISGITEDQTIATEDAQPKAAETDPIQIETSPASQENTTREDGLSLQQIYESNILSVVSIACSYRNGSSTGTGVVLSKEGYIVTNCHVVEDADTIQILLQDDRVLDAQLVGLDSVSDLAVLWVEAEDLQPATLGDSSALRVGDQVVAIGDPLGIELRGTMTDGIVSSINRDVNVGGRVMNLIQTNAALNSGNSGGPLLNCYGQVIGINTMKMGDQMSTAGVEGLGFAIPSNTVSEIVNQLISQGYVSGRPYVGIGGEEVGIFEQVYCGLPAGLYITEVEAGSPAEETGLHAGDILLSLDGTRIYGLADLETALYSFDPGDKVEITIYRNGRKYSGTITVGEAK